MPMYEYRCEPCDRSFETLVRSAGDVPHCPTCRGTTLVKQFSVPASARVSGSNGGLPVCSPDPGPKAGGCGAPWCGTGACGMG